MKSFYQTAFVRHLFIRSVLLVGVLPVLLFAAEPAEQTSKELQGAIFAGGCFWCMEKPFESIPGVKEVLSGYSGGHVSNPTYEQVSSGTTGHREVVQVLYDPSQVSYEKLLEVFWKNVDPYDDGGQFCDRGFQYSAAIFAGNAAEEKAAQESLTQVFSRSEQKRVKVPILDAQAFYPAEEYHQNYYQTHPIRYRYYRYRCGRDARLEDVWGKR